MTTMQRTAVPRRELLELVGSAVLAPSGHNTQPWHFHLSEGRIDIRPDFARTLPVVDPDDHALFISLGAALENLRIAAHQRGLDAEAEYFPPIAPDSLVVRLSPMRRPDEGDLFRAIPERQSTRTTYDGRPIPTGDLRRLEAASEQPGVRFQLFTGAKETEPLIELVREANRQQMNDHAFVEELIDWIRFSRAEVERHGDGLAAPVMGMPHAPRWIGSPIMRAFLRPELQPAQAEKLVRSSSALMLFVAERNDRESWVRLGQSFERVALTATLLGIRQAHLNMPCEVLEVRRQLQQHLGLEEEQPLLMLRIGYGRPMPRSPRRPLAEVVS